MADLRATCAALSDPGRDPEKQVNEDAYATTALQNSLFVVVCDGMGGHAGGRLASTTAVEVVQRVLAGSDPLQPTQLRLHRAISEASSAVYRLGGEAANHERPGATCVAVWLHQNTLDVAHVGDSRAYRLRDGKLEALTRDHSVIEVWIAAGQVTREQAHQHPDAHRITRALGINPTVEVELRPTDSLLVGDQILLCSDGLTDLVTDDELRALMGRPIPLGQRVKEAILLANSRGGHDNITAVLIEVVPLAYVDSTKRSDVRPHPTETVAALVVDLTTASVRLANTEQLPTQLDPLERTVAIDAVDQTILMDHPRTPIRTALGGAGAENKTVPFAQPGIPAIDPGKPPIAGILGRPSSPPRVGLSPRQLGKLLAIALLLVGLAILFGLFRR